jgi:predicted anti-sigma-YlaC factor YlaD
VSRRMSCQEVREGLTEYLDSALSTDRQGMEEHLEKCETCRRRSVEVAALIAATRARGSGMPSATKNPILEAFRRLPPR